MAWSKSVHFAVWYSHSICQCRIEVNTSMNIIEMTDEQKMYHAGHMAYMIEAMRMWIVKFGRSGTQNVNEWTYIESVLMKNVDYMSIERSVEPSVFILTSTSLSCFLVIFLYFTAFQILQKRTWKNLTVSTSLPLASTSQ